jgi:Xaa-Pro aminopeptidase
LASFTTILLAALLCNYGRGKCLIDIGTEGCAEVSDAGARAFLAGAKEGRSEREILVEVESALKLAGSDEVSFTTQVGSGPATASICPYPTDRRLSQGDIVQLDCGASCFGYRGDISRVAVVGDPPTRLRMFMDVTARMYDAMFAALRPGLVVSDLARIGVEVAREHGLYECLYSSPTHDVGFMGHAIGTGFHEPPEICLEDHSEIQEDMVLVLEPILREDGLGGVKLEDAVLVTATGADPLSKCPLRTW